MHSRVVQANDPGYTGQVHDAVTGLDYYNARYYDPVVGQFLSPDSVQGNAQGMDPYAYVGGNPESRTDPTGQLITCGLDNPSCGDPARKPNANDCAADPDLDECSPPAQQGDQWEQPSHPAPTPTQSKQAPTKKQTPTQTVNTAELGEGLAEFLAGAVLLVGGIAGIVTAADSGLLSFLAGLLKHAFGGIAYLMNQGIRSILSAFGTRVNPWVKVFFDVVAVVLDAVQIANNVIDLISIGGGLENARVLQTLGEDINQVVGKILIANPGQVLDSMIDSMKGIGGSLVAGVPTFFGDLGALGSDWKTATDS